ncbi:HK97 gp10 family phage protein [Robertmurraya korlensis]|uniref:HK97 gp10 family phage protein n=1 Tax=Robertmurraya korlensis TaxID=519977 RepID=UPI00203E19A4|nr:HK97 gp10 family phage protein [Robertmurraya korlensis]MCM3599390.1 HK97 gp10 family phage protein [Robertmurraya korlensis]
MIRMEMRGFKKYNEQLMFIKNNFPEELEKFLLDLGKSLNRAVLKRTPVDDGELKGAWKISGIERDGDTVYLMIYNTATTTYEGREVPLAPFVEFGHKIVDKSGNTVGKVDGYYMLTTSIKTINRTIPRRLRKMFNELVSRA